MKKTLSFALWALSAVVLWYGITMAATLSATDFTDLLWSSSSKDFWYSSSKKISIQESDMKTTSVKITSPVLKDEFEDPVTDYIMFYGTESFENVLDYPSRLEDYKEVLFSPSDKSASTFTMDIDGLKSNQIYHVVVVPRNDYEDLWDISNELCFKLDWKIIWEWDECEKSDTNHSSSSSNCENNDKILNLSCTWDWKKVTVSWDKLKEHLRISLFNESSNNWTVKKESIDAYNQTTFSFDVTQSKAPKIRFEATDNLCTPKTYTCHTLNTTTTTPTKTTTVKPVVVWPKENIIAVIFGAVVLYLVYRVVRRKAD